MKRYDYLVVGSGLYGAIFAHEAKVKGKSVLVVDKRPNIAGNVYTEKQEGLRLITTILMRFIREYQLVDIQRWLKTFLRG